MSNSTLCVLSICMCILHIMYVLSICKLFLHCLEHVLKNFTHVLWSCDNESDLIWWTGVMWITCGLLWCFYKLFRLSFWRHPFTAGHPLLSKWRNATFLKIWWRNKLLFCIKSLLCFFQMNVIWFAISLLNAMTFSHFYISAKVSRGPVYVGSKFPCQHLCAHMWCPLFCFPLGNSTLLRCCELWKRLLDHYYRAHCVVNPASDINVQSREWRVAVLIECASQRAGVW